MPVNHDAFTAVAHVPLRHEVLITGAELFGVRSAGRRRLAPDMRQADPKHPIDNLGNGFAEFFFSSRRRHTRSLCDWSSDVCSSDLSSSGPMTRATRSPSLR